MGMIRSVLIEIRPGLGTCTVCILLKESFKANVKVRKNMVLLNVEDEEFTIPYNDFEVEPLTMTCLNIEDGWINFRIGVTYCKELERIPFKKISPVRPNEITKLHCRCGCPVTEEVTFKRVLPLPSHDIDMSDMFCHFDEHSKMSLSPKFNDCLYGIHYVSVNKEMLRNVRMNFFIKCMRCLSCIGSCNKEMIKLWNVCITLPEENLTPVEEFKRILRSTIQDSFVLFLKIFLECMENNNGLLISVMDRDLVLSRGDENLKLKACHVLKLKYEYYKSYNDNLKMFLEKENVRCIEVPRDVLNDGFDFLLKSSEEIPPALRVVEGELMAYLEI